MMAGRMGLNPAAIPDNPLSLSWHDSTWIPILNTANVMEYFSERSNPFFDRTCNNEIIKMQRLNPDQLQNMTGLEYILLHVQEPILHVIRKQHRYSPTQVTPLADYYIIAGVVYQAPDLASVLNSRLLSCVHHLQQSFDEVAGYSRYHPSRGYTWDFKPPAATVAQPALPGRPGAAAAATNSSTSADTSKNKGKDEKVAKEEPSSMFQRQRVDMLLGELIKKFPLPNQMPSLSAAASTSTITAIISAAPKVSNPSNSTANLTSASATPLVTVKTEPGTIVSSAENGNSGTCDIKDAIITEVKQEKIKVPPEKKVRLN